MKTFLVNFKITAKARNNIFKVVEIILIAAWLMAMKESDALFIPYLVVGILGILCCYNRKKYGIKSFDFLAFGFALLFVFFVSAANYKIFPTTFSWSNSIQFILQIINIILGSFVVFYNIFIYTPVFLSKVKVSRSHQKQQKIKPAVIFLIAFGIIALIYVAVLLLCKNPGILSYDSIVQVKQVLTGVYSDHHPISSTMLIALGIKIGQAIFGDINAGIVIYNIIQILIMAAIFAYSIMTLYQARCSKKVLVPILIFYALAPYHIMYSMTVWKDILFSGFTLLFVVVQYRLFHNLGVKWLNYVILGLSVILFCLFRHNGLYVCIAAVLLFVILFRKRIFQQKSLLLNVGIIGGATILYCIFNTVIISVFQIIPTSKAESLSIPAQQIARTVIDSGDLSDEQMYLLDQVLNLETLSEVYIPWVSDPIKNQVGQSKGGEAFLIEHKAEFIKLYLSVGVKHPIQYLQAWSDQTRGFFNGGYLYWVVYDAIDENDFGIERRNDQSIFNKIFNIYLTAFEEDGVLRIFYCIGFYVWIAIWLLYCTIIEKRKDEAFITAIPLLLIGTLLIATPVFSEFRYAYPLVCCIPFLLAVVLKRNKKIARK